MIPPFFYALWRNQSLAGKLKFSGELEWFTFVSPVGRGLAPAVQDYSGFRGGPKGPPYPKHHPKILM